MDESIIKEYYLIIKNKILNESFQSALSNIDKLLSYFPNSDWGYYYKGVCEFALENYEEALRSYTAAIKLNPAFAKAYFNLGVIYYMWSKYDDALINIGKSLIIFSKIKELDSKERCIEALRFIGSEVKNDE